MVLALSSITWWRSMVIIQIAHGASVIVECICMRAFRNDRCKACDIARFTPIVSFTTCTASLSSKDEARAMNTPVSDRLFDVLLTEVQRLQWDNHLSLADKTRSYQSRCCCISRLFLVYNLNKPECIREDKRISSLSVFFTSTCFVMK